jgi:hypothetical protein
MKNNNLREIEDLEGDKTIDTTFINIESDSMDYNNKKIILDEQIYLKINNIIDFEYIIEKYNPKNISDDLMDSLIVVAND